MRGLPILAGCARLGERSPRRLPQSPTPNPQLPAPRLEAVLRCVGLRRRTAARRELPLTKKVETNVRAPSEEWVGQNPERVKPILRRPQCVTLASTFTNGL